MRRTLLLLAAMLIAAFGTALVYLYVRGADNRALGDQSSVRVWVLNQDVGINDPASAAMASPLDVPHKAVVPGAITSPVQLQGKYFKVPAVKGQQVLDGMLGATRSSGLRPGQAAISISVSTNSPLLQAGSTVQVYRTVNGRIDPVLARATVYQLGRGSSSTVVTFILSVQEATLLADAQASGAPLSLLVLG